jgi:predicted metallo-beta-lactamase superfamily hydrolase
MDLEIIGTESMGVRGLCCRLALPDRRIVIDPGISLGYRRFGLLPHPLQVAAGRSVRDRILQELRTATDVVFSHFHGDHVPLLDANPYQLAIRDLPSGFSALRCWSKAEDDLSADMRHRFQDLAHLSGDNMQIAEGCSAGPLAFSGAVPHGVPGSHLGTLMMTRVETGQRAFVHASDIQLLDDATVTQIIDWQADIVVAAGPPLYLERLSKAEKELAWENALRLVKNVKIVILDHHLMRSVEGVEWLAALSAKLGRRVYCAADFMGCPRRLLEAERVRWYEQMPVADAWHDDYAEGRVDLEDYFYAVDMKRSLSYIPRPEKSWAG